MAINQIAFAIGGQKVQQRPKLLLASSFEDEATANEALCKAQTKPDPGLFKGLWCTAENSIGDLNVHTFFG